jgi:hypothetical protein
MFDSNPFYHVDGIKRWKSFRLLIEKAKKDSIEKACIDSIGKAKRDSIEKAVRDSLIRENDKKKALEAIKKTADKKKVDKKAGDNLPFDDMNEVQNSN